jgi:hypothetical protein
MTTIFADRADKDAPIVTCSGFVACRRNHDGAFWAKQLEKELGVVR